MPSAKDGKAGQLVAPAAPREAKDADTADPGEIAKIKAAHADLDKGKHGEVAAPAFKPAKPSEDSPDDTKPTHWIEVKMVDELDQPVPGIAYRIELPDGRVDEGTLNEKGMVRLEGIPDAGNCKVSFPKLDKDAWSKC